MSEKIITINEDIDDINNGNINPYEELAVRIIIRAKKDWEKTLRKIKKQLNGYNYEKLINDLEYIKYTKSTKSETELLKDRKYKKISTNLKPYLTNTTISSIENFINKEWFETLCLKVDPCLVRDEFENIRKNIMNGEV